MYAGMNERWNVLLRIYNSFIQYLTTPFHSNRFNHTFSLPPQHQVGGGQAGAGEVRDATPLRHGENQGRRGGRGEGQGRDEGRVGIGVLGYGFIF